MSKFLTNKAKLLYFALGIMMFIVLLGALVYMTQYAHIHIYFNRSATGAISFASDTQDSLQNTNQMLYEFFQKTSDTTFIKDFGSSIGDNYATTVYNFQTAMSSFNDLIVTFAIFGILCFAGLLVLSNHSRKVYYKSNLYGGIVLPAITAIFSIVMIIKNLSLMGTFNKNYELFNRVAILQNPDLKTEASRHANDIQYLKDLYSADSTTFIIFTIIFGIVCLYSLFLIGYAVYRYKASADERKQIIEKAVLNND